MTEDAKKRLAQLVEARRKKLRMKQTEIADFGGPSHTTVGNVESADWNTLSDRTIDGLEKALAWKQGSIVRILAGGDPIEAPALRPTWPPQGPATVRLVYPNAEGGWDTEDEGVADQYLIDMGFTRALNWVATCGRFGAPASDQAAFVKATTRLYESVDWERIRALIATDEDAEEQGQEFSDLDPQLDLAALPNDEKP